MSDLNGKVAIVTGAARGIGRAYAHRLAKLGAKVAVCDLRLKAYDEFKGEAAEMTASTTVDEINRDGGEAIGLEFDVSDRDGVFAAADEVAKAWGSIDILVANAGGGRGTPQETKASMIPPEWLEQVTNINWYGTVHSCSAVAPYMKEQRSGRIITVASYAGRRAATGGGYAHYGANKAAIAHYTQYLAQELGRYNITANCIAPGFIATARVVEALGGEAAVDDIEKTIALRRSGTPDDCAKVIEFLCSDLADYVTGALIPIDGGWNR